MGKIIELITAGVKILLFGILIASVGSFTSFLLSLIPSFHFTGCMGFWANQLGIVEALRLFISIIVYGYTVKFGLRYFSTYI